MPHQVTVTGLIGPARTVTSAVILNVNQILFIPDSKEIRLRTNDSGTIRDFDVSAATTVTCTISAGNYAFVVS